LANSERDIKHQRVRDYLQEHNLDGVLLSRRCNFSWYTCGAHNVVCLACDVGNSLLLVGRDRAWVITNNIEAERLAGEELAESGIEVVSFEYADPSDRKRIFQRLLDGRRLAVDAPVDGVNARLLGRGFDRLRWSLTDGEIERYRRLCDDVVVSLESVARAAEPGQTENGLAGLAAWELWRRGCTPWLLLVGADDRVVRFRHPLPTDRRVEGYFMLITCAERDGLIAACSRLAAFGSLPEGLAEKHRAVATVAAALISATRPGASLGDIFAIAQESYAATGFEGEWRRHHQGGSCGYLPREVKAAPGETIVAMDRQAFAWNPSIAGTKSEDTILCRQAGPELLAKPTDWPMLEAEWNGFRITRPDILVR